MRREAQRDVWRETGRDLGYPSCCIENFCTRGFSLTKEQKQVADLGYGFVPCPEHAKEIVAGRDIATLINNRIKSLPKFPDYV